MQSIREIKFQYEDIIKKKKKKKTWPNGLVGGEGPLHLVNPSSKHHKA
jgi:hypothetical protein